MSDDKLDAIQAAAFRHLVAHLRRTDVQNIDLMNLAGFCRTCLSKWLRAGPKTGRRNRQPQEAIYGMPYQNGRTNIRSSSVGRRRHSLIAAASTVTRWPGAN